MGDNNEINEIGEIIKKMSGDLAGFKEELKKVNSRLEAIEKNLVKSDGEVLEILMQINRNLEDNR
ncbi:hypothetical protein MZM54_32810 [[Brevibacterium] frigoritolerans]|nr:hypothetical protein [Peribacillus frigoritolerans]